MRKVGKILMGLFLIFIFVGCGKKVDTEKSELYSKKADEAIQLLNNGDRTKLKEQFNEEMKQGMTDENFNTVEEAIKETGAFEKIEKSSVTQKDKFYSTVTIVKYSDKKIVFTINYDDEEKIAGLFIK